MTIMVDYSKNGPEVFRGRGDVHSNVYGMRNWRVSPDGHLGGMVYRNAVWGPGTNVAKCLRVRGPAMRYGLAGGVLTTADEIDMLGEPDHDLYDCLHGFYAYYDGSRDYHEAGDVTGIIQGWGDGVLGARGFRVMRARIRAIVFDDTVTADVRAKVIVNYPGAVVFRTLVGMLTRFPTSADDLEYVPDPDDNFWTRTTEPDDD